MKEYNETPKEMAAKIRQLFSEHCSSSLNDDAIFTTERAEKECALIYIKGIIENAYIKWLMPEDTNNPFLRYWNEVEKEIRKQGMKSKKKNNLKISLKKFANSK